MIIKRRVDDEGDEIELDWNPLVLVLKTLNFFDSKGKKKEKA